jgi:hypothetical protein
MSTAAVPMHEQVVGSDGSIWMIFRVPNFSFTYNGENAPGWTAVITLQSALPKGAPARNVWYSGGLTAETIMDEPRRWIEETIDRWSAKLLVA